VKLIVLLFAALSLSGIRSPYKGIVGTGATYVAAGLALDAGFPSVTTATTTLNGGMTLASSTFSTTGIRTIVVAAAYNAFDSGGNPPTLAWTGGTPACAGAFSAVTSSANNVSYNLSGIWSATTSANCTNVGVTLSRAQNNSGANDAAGIAVFSFSNVGSFGTPVQNNDNGSALGVTRATLTTVVGSYVVAVSCFGGDNSTTAAGTQTSAFGIRNGSSDENQAAYTQATGTSTLIGWGTGASISWVGFSAVEIKQ